MVATTKNDSLAPFLRLTLGSLLGMFVSGAGMTAIGQPTTTHVLSSVGSALWHTLLILHLLFLVGVAIGAVIILEKAFTEDASLKLRAILGVIAIIFGIVSGALVLHEVHPGIFLFFMALAFLLIGFAYGPLARSRNVRMH